MKKNQLNFQISNIEKTDSGYSVTLQIPGSTPRIFTRAHDLRGHIANVETLLDVVSKSEEMKNSELFRKLTVSAIDSFYTVRNDLTVVELIFKEIFKTVK